MVLDRYSFSGTAYSVAKGLNFDWCMNSEHKLIKPDFVVYLRVEDLS